MENKIADALSRRPIEAISYAAASTVQPTWMASLIDSYFGDTKVTEIISQLNLDDKSNHGYTLLNGVLYYKGRMVVGEATDLRKKLLQLYHNSPLGGHSGMHNTYMRIKRHFFPPGLLTSIMDWFKQCDFVLCAKESLVQLLDCYNPYPFPHMLGSI